MSEEITYVNTFAYRIPFFGQLNKKTEKLENASKRYRNIEQTHSYLLDSEFVRAHYISISLFLARGVVRSTLYDLFATASCDTQHPGR